VPKSIVFVGVPTEIFIYDVCLPKGVYAGGSYEMPPPK
jgi:hypothetical protein